MQQFPYIAEIFVIGGLASAAVIAVDLRSCRQPMRIMNSVWILTGLWASFFGLWAYFAFGRTRSCLLRERTSVPERQRPERAGAAAPPHPHGQMPTDESAGTAPHRSMPIRDAHTGKMADMQMDGMDMPDMPMHGANGGGMTDESAVATPHRSMPMRDAHAGGMADMQMDGMDMPGMRMEGPARPRWQSVVLSTLHCGAGCTLADLLGEWFLYFVPIAIGGSLLAGSWVVDYVLALLFGIGFQYAAIRGMERSLPRGVAIRRAAQADFWSLTAWQAGMYGWMAVVIFVLRDGATLPRDTFSFWFMMQIAMACGFLVALPVNVVLIRRGIKHGM